ncbi:MAG: hypothetical protein RLZZ598_1335, partial [Pseudomonadota bacterium]
MTKNMIKNKARKSLIYGLFKCFILVPSARLEL